MELSLVITIAELITKHGIPAALKILQAWKVENPTLADIEELKNRVPHPDFYLGEEDG